MLTNPYERIAELEILLDKALSSRNIMHNRAEELEKEVERLKGLCQVDRDAVEGAIDCLKSYLRAEECGFESDVCMNGCTCVDMSVINSLNEALEKEGE